MTLREAYAKGFTDGDKKLTVGYQTRKQQTAVDVLDEPVKYAKKRKAWYYELSAPGHSNMHYRVYLRGADHGTE